MWRRIPRIAGLVASIALGVAAFLQRDEGDRDVTSRFALLTVAAVAFAIVLALAAARSIAGGRATVAFIAVSVGFVVFARTVAVGSWQLRSIYPIWIAYAVVAGAFWILALIRGQRPAD